MSGRPRMIGRLAVRRHDLALAAILAAALATACGSSSEPATSPRFEVEELVGRYAEFLARYNPLLYPVARAADAMRTSDQEIAAARNDRLANRRRGAYQTTRKLAASHRLRPAWTPRTAADWLTAQASVKV